MTDEQEDNGDEEPSFITDEKARVAETSEDDPRDDQSEEESG
jgi:hypothetical protein